MISLVMPGGILVVLLMVDYLDDLRKQMVAVRYMTVIGTGLSTWYELLQFH